MNSKSTSPAITPTKQVKTILPLTILSMAFNILCIALIAIFVLKLVVYQQVVVDGKSSYPNYDDDQMLLINQIDKNFERGQVVAVYSDKEVAKNANYFTRFNAKFYLKRVIGLPGEEIEIIGGTVIIYNRDNPTGAILNENYVLDSAKSQQNNAKEIMARRKIPFGEYFLMGDNRPCSADSRSFGTFSSFAIFGKENFRLTPISEFHVFALPASTFTPKTAEEIEAIRKSVLSDTVGNDEKTRTRGEYLAEYCTKKAKN
jgi:signal peptidase I